MERLGSSVEAAWDHSTDQWREDVIQVTKELKPGMIRRGDIPSAHTTGGARLSDPEINVSRCSISSGTGWKPIKSELPTQRPAWRGLAFEINTS